jgi:putative ABC transport system permease protein
MLIAALRDMHWRRRRLVIAIISTGLVFAMTLVLTRLVNGFRVEAQRTVDAMAVDAFVVKAGAAGPFLGSTPFAHVDVARVAAAPGVEAAAPLATAASTIREGASARNATGRSRLELAPAHATTNRLPETVQLKAGEVLFEQCTMGDLIYVVSRVSSISSANWPTVVRSGQGGGAR